MNYDRLVTLKVLQQEISVLKTKAWLEDSGHIYTAISVIKDRIQELERELTPEEQTWYELNAN
jgi:hypothetical protein